MNGHTPSPPKILLTGATGYIGGSVLHHLLQSDVQSLKNASITCLVRGAARIAKLNTEYGRRVNPVLFQDLGDTDRIIDIASQHDIAINTTLGYHPASAAAVVKGLAKRKQATGKDVYMIHTSGTSNLADQPISKAYVEQDAERVFDDSKDDVYSYEKHRNNQTAYPQRTAELGVIDAGKELGVKTLVIMSPTIYGVGSGHFNTSSIQVPGYVKATLAEGEAVIVGDGAGIWDNVHVEDLAELYQLALLDIVDHAGSNLPFGEKGIIFSGNGRHTWRELAQGVADAAFEAGKIKSKEVKSVSVEQGARVLTGGDTLLVELGFSSNSRTKSTVARENLGWKPKYGPEAWRKGFKEEVDAAIRQG